ncbi:MAG: LysM peptidoglycan-binding domain-containing protein [Hyphomicrobiaceae bacterium]
MAGGAEVDGSAAGGSAASGPETAAGAGSGGGTVGDATTRGSTDSEGQTGGTQAGKPTTTTDGTATVPAGDATSADDTAAGAKTGEAATDETGAGEDGIPEPSSSLIEKAGEMAAEVSRRFSNWFGTEADKADALAISTVSYRLLGPRAGEATISGRAPLGLEVRLAIDGTDVGITRAGENGRFLYEATYWLSPGPHTATAEAVDSAGRTVLETEFSFDRERQQADDAVVADADAGGKTAAPGEADGSGSAAGAGTARPVPSADGFAIRSILYESLGQKRGRVTVSGSGAPDADVRVVIDDDDIGMTRSDATGAWVLDSDYWVRPGTHGVRAELLAPNGDTIAGLDQEFRREAAMADAGAAGGSLASADDAAGSPALTGESQKADGEAAASDAPLEIAGATTSARQLRKPGRKSFKRRTLKAGTVAAARRHASRRATRAGWSQKRRRAAAVAARHSTHKTVRILRGTKREVVRVPVGRRLWSRRHGFLSEGGRRYHRVRRGDTLWGIARRYYGRGSRYPRIYGANRRRIRNPDLIYPRQRLLIP